MAPAPQLTPCVCGLTEELTEKTVGLIFTIFFFCQKAAGAICSPVRRASVCTEMWGLMAPNSVHTWGGPR